MARSRHVYVVMNGGIPVAAFTVKHELRAWLAREGYGRSTVHRLHDGGYPRGSVVLDADEIRKPNSGKLGAV